MTIAAWQVDAMVEAAAAAEWERINEPDANDSRKNYAAEMLQAAIWQLCEIEDMIDQAADQVEGLPAEDRIGSFVEEIGDMRHGIGTLVDQLRRCEI